MKAKTVKLHSKQLKSIIVDNHEPTIFQEESPSLFHLLQARSMSDHQCARREWSHSVDHERNSTHLCNVHERQIRANSGGGGECGPNGEWWAPNYRDRLDMPITTNELKTVVHRGVGNKAPGRDGICLAFFKANWETIKEDMLALFNQMYIDGKIRE